MVIAGDIREISCCGKVLDSSMLRNFVPSKIAAQYKRAVKLRKLGGIVCPQCLQKPISGCVEPTTNSQLTSPENKLNCRLCAKLFVLPAAELDDFLALEIAAVIHGWKRCPGCTTLIEKTEGCNHMSCICGISWCYACGDMYGEVDHDTCYNL